MSKLATAGQLVENVMVNGQEVPLGEKMTIEQVRQELESTGVVSNIGKAQPYMVNDTTVEFVNERGTNG